MKKQMVLVALDELEVILTQNPVLLKMIRTDANCFSRRYEEERRVGVKVNVLIVFTFCSCLSRVLVREVVSHVNFRKASLHKQTVHEGSQ